MSNLVVKGQGCIVTQQENVGRIQSKPIAPGSYNVRGTIDQHDERKMPIVFQGWWSKVKVVL